MKKSIFIGVAMVLLIVSVALLWPRFHSGTDRSGPSGTTTMQLAGTEGTLFTGWDVRDGQCVAVSNAVPWTFDSSGISEFELRKVNPGDTFVLEARYDGAGMHSQSRSTVGPGVLGVRVRVQNGLSAETITR